MLSMRMLQKAMQDCGSQKCSTERNDGFPPPYKAGEADDGEMHAVCSDNGSKKARGFESVKLKEQQKWANLQAE